MGWSLEDSFSPKVTEANKGNMSIKRLGLVLEESCSPSDRGELELAVAWGGAVKRGHATPRSLAEGKKVGLAFSSLATSQEAKLGRPHFDTLSF